MYLKMMAKSERNYVYISKSSILDERVIEKLTVVYHIYNQASF